MKYLKQRLSFPGKVVIHIFLPLQERILIHYVKLIAIDKQA